MRGPGGGRGGDFARPYEKRGPPGNDQRYFAKPSNKPYSPQVPPATLALLVSLQGAPWRTASDFRRQLVRAGHAPVPPVAAIDGASALRSGLGCNRALLARGLVGRTALWLRFEPGRFERSNFMNFRGYAY